jgi:hypothetical protein
MGRRGGSVGAHGRSGSGVSVLLACKPLEDAVLSARGRLRLMMLSIARHQIMIRNGIYLAETTFLDGVDAYNRHVMVLRDGTMRGDGGFYYTVGSYTCSGGKWKGEMTSTEHSPISVEYPWAGKVLTIGFAGAYSDDCAEFEATALAGKRSFRFKSVYRLLFAD